MDQPIRLRHETTEQECEFPDEAAVENFQAEIADAASWQRVGDATPEATGNAVTVDLAELRAAVAADDHAPTRRRKTATKEA